MLFRSGDASWRAVRTATIPIMKCPSDFGHELPWSGTAGPGWARGNYACNAAGIHQPDSLGWTSTENGRSPTSAWTNAWVGLPDTTKAGGVMCINYGAALPHISNADGTATTILISEIRVGSHLSPADPRGTWAAGFPGASVDCASYTWDCTHPNDNNGSADDCEGAVDDPAGGMGAWLGCPFQQAQSRSHHAGGGVVVAMCDGSVRWVKNNISQQNWWRMHARDDGVNWTDD